jgi:hypothetical protein
MRSIPKISASTLLLALATLSYCAAARASGGEDRSYLPQTMRSDPAAPGAKYDTGTREAEGKTNVRKGRARTGRTKYARRDNDFGLALSGLFRFLRD